MAWAHQLARSLVLELATRLRNYSSVLARIASFQNSDHTGSRPTVDEHLVFLGRIVSRGFLVWQNDGRFGRMSVRTSGVGGPNVTVMRHSSTGEVAGYKSDHAQREQQYQCRDHVPPKAHVRNAMSVDMNQATG